MMKLSDAFGRLAQRGPEVAEIGLDFGHRDVVTHWVSDTSSALQSECELTNDLNDALSVSNVEKIQVTGDGKACVPICRKTDV